MLGCPVLVLPLVEFACEQFTAGCLSRFINKLFRINRTIALTVVGLCGTNATLLIFDVLHSCFHF